MLLLDTSIWVEVFRKRRPLDLEAHLDFEEVVTCLPVIQEVLQGFDDQRAFRLAREAMLSLPMVESSLEASIFEEAVGLYRSARRLGLTVRSGTDCLIAACALRNSLAVVHRDRDFDALAQVAPLETVSL
ncbi:MAG: PIN domain-containing protein [bacterium]|nr:PIN domain-containing protein [bacterium]